MTSVSSLMLGTTDVERLHAWYAAVLPPEVDQAQEQYHILGYGAFYLFLDPRDDVAGSNGEPGRFLVNFDVEDARAVEQRADEHRATWISRVEDRDGSLFGTLADPDGNAVQIIQLSPEARAEMAGSA
ncbi:MAG: VOC family protein [Nocardioides sp.]